ncbi:MAG: NHL repeat-containing protein, partial [Candidatus Margulisiibacteriota bacterium]
MKIFVKGILIFFLTVTFLTGIKGSALGFEKLKFIGELRSGLEKPVDVAVSEKGNVYILDERASKITVFDSDGTLTTTFGSSGSKEAQLKNPRSLALSTEGNIFIADTGNNRIQIFNGKGELISTFGSSGSLPGQFSFPAGIDIDQFGFIYVADSNNKRVQIFGPEGIFFSAWSTEDKPYSLAVDPQRNVYVLLTLMKKIVKYSPTGEKLSEISCIKDKRDRFSKEAGFAVDCRGDIYISGNSDGNIRKLDPDQTLLLAFGSEGEDRGQFNTPLGIATDMKGSIYIADSINKRVQIFAISGSLKPNIEPELTSPPYIGSEGVIASQKGTADLSVISGEKLYILSDSSNIHINVKENKKDAGSFGGTGNKTGDFNKPSAIDVSPEDKIFIADTGNN